MPIIAKDSGGSSDFIPAPAGAHAAICVDVIDLGIIEVTYPGKPTRKQHAIRIAWQIAEDMADGKPFLVHRRYTLSLHEKSSLRKDLESWRGRPFTAEELEGFDLEKLLGVRCMISVIHTKKGDNTYANVSGIMKLPKGMAELNVRDYVRLQDRTQDEQDRHRGTDEISMEDLPF